MQGDALPASALMDHRVARLPRSIDRAEEVFIVRERNAEARNAEGTRCSFATVH